MLAEHFKYDLKGQRLATLTKAQIETLPAGMRPYVQPLLPEYQETQAAIAAARNGHVEDCITLAGRA